MYYINKIKDSVYNYLKKKFEPFGDEKVSAIKKVMPDYVKYESIRAVILENYINKDQIKY